MVVVVMGPAGAGKTTVGQALARDLGWSFHDADDLHPDENVARMRAGIALGDTERASWLEAVRALAGDRLAAGESAVIACSALTRAYRRALLPDGAAGGVRFVYLRADAGLLDARLRSRRGHFFGAELLASQLAALEAPSPDEPAPVLTLDADVPVPSLVRHIRRELRI